MLTEQDFTDRRLYTWHVDGTTAKADYACDGYTQGGAFVARLAAIADEANHHPDVSLAYPGVVTVVTTSHDVEDLTARDLDLAGAIDAAAQPFLKRDE